MSLYYIVPAIYIVGILSFYLLSPLFDLEGNNEAIVCGIFWPVVLCMFPFVFLADTRNKIATHAKKRSDEKVAKAKEIADIEKELDSVKWDDRFGDVGGVRISAVEPVNEHLLYSISQDEIDMLKKYREQKQYEAKVDYESIRNSKI
jgi:hypothetical protein